MSCNKVRTNFASMENWYIKSKLQQFKENMPIVDIIRDPSEQLEGNDWDREENFVDYIVGNTHMTNPIPESNFTCGPMFRIARVTCIANSNAYKDGRYYLKVFGGEVVLDSNKFEFLTQIDETLSKEKIIADILLKVDMDTLDEINIKL